MHIDNVFVILWPAQQLYYNEVLPLCTSYHLLTELQINDKAIDHTMTNEPLLCYSQDENLTFNDDEPSSLCTTVLTESHVNSKAVDQSMTIKSHIHPTSESG